MKITGHFFLTIIAIVLFLNGCKKPAVSETRLNDLNSVTAEFKSPPAEYTTAPFFVWNYKITRAEIDKFLADFSNSGSKQIFIHPRPGLITEYLSGEWLELVDYTVRKGRELGMKVWIYDENSYPSGFAGGHVPDRMPESYNQGQGLVMKEFEIVPDTAEKYYLCLKDENGILTDITSSVENEKGRNGKYFLFLRHFTEKAAGLADSVMSI